MQARQPSCLGICGSLVGYRFSSTWRGDKVKFIRLSFFTAIFCMIASAFAQAQQDGARATCCRRTVCVDWLQ